MHGAVSVPRTYFVVPMPLAPRSPGVHSRGQRERPPPTHGANLSGGSSPSVACEELSLSLSLSCCPRVTDVAAAGLAAAARARRARRRPLPYRAAARGALTSVPCSVCAAAPAHRRTTCRRGSNRWSGGSNRWSGRSARATSGRRAKSGRRAMCAPLPGRGWRSEGSRSRRCISSHSPASRRRRRLRHGLLRGCRGDHHGPLGGCHSPVRPRASPW
mmetsp:Transcript_8366/g.20071  ORF Transcript_8366/g.20071 Transcript_8366/m.20071 type:complete len:216 (-) Transcript_8366:1010-1657(-)